MGRGRGVRATGTALLAAGMLLSAAACGTGSVLDAAATESPTGTSASATETTSPTSTSPGTSTDDSGGELDSDDEGRRLTLSDFFGESSGWDEQRYDIADQEDVQGIGTEIAGCGSSNADELELRLGNKFETLEFSVGQANDSARSDQELSVEVLANNEQVEVRNVPFNEIQSFTIDVNGVNALKIRLSLDDRISNCGGSVVGVVTDVMLD